MSGHAKYSPSSAHRWINCTGYFQFEKYLPETLPSKYALEGTLAHLIASHCLVTDSEPKEMINTKWSLQGKKDKTTIATKEITESAQKYYEYVLKKAGDSKLHVEKKVYLSKKVFGTVDCWFLKDDILYVIDFKHGKGVIIEPKNNLQLIIYALAILRKIKCKKVRLTIVQPRAHSGKRIKTWIVTPQKINRWKKKIDQVVERENHIFKTGDHCKWCPAMALCPEISNKALAIKDIKYTDTNKLLEVLDEIPAIKAYVSEVEKHAYKMLHEGKRLPGWKLVEKRSHSKWKNETRALEYLEKKGFKDLYVKKIKTITELRKLCGYKTINKLIETRSSGLTLAKETDKRKEIDSLEYELKD